MALSYKKEGFECMAKAKNINFHIFNNFIYWTRLDAPPFGHEQGLNRPCLVIHTTKESGTCIVVPLTLERLNDNIPYHIDLDNSKSTVLLEHIKSIDKARIYAKLYQNKKHATITENDRTRINEQLAKIIRLKPIFKKSVDK